MKKIVKNIALLISAGIAVLQLTGCAFGTRNVCLQYTPSMYPPSVADSPVVLVHAPKDVRHEPSLGCVRNGWGMKTAKVEAKIGEPSAPLWIARALSHDLTLAGCSVIYKDPSDGKEPDFVIGGSLQKTYVDSYMSMEGEILLDLWMKNKDRVALNRHYQANAKKMNWWGSSAEFQKTLDLTLQNLMEQMLPEITSAMHKNYEDLPPAAKETDSLSDKLSELKKLRDEGLISEEEYVIKKESAIESL